MAVTLGCHSLLKHLKTLLIKSSLGKVFPKKARWLTMCVNLFCMLWMFSFVFILKSSYSWVSVLILDLFTLVVPSCVSWSVSHISLALVQFEILKYSSIPRAEVKMFLALRLYWTLLLSSSDHLSLRFFYCCAYWCASIYYGGNIKSYFYGFPNVVVYDFNKDLHLGYPVVVTLTIKDRWPMDGVSFGKLRIWGGHESWSCEIFLKIPALIPLVGSSSLVIIKKGGVELIINVSWLIKIYPS